MILRRQRFQPCRIDEQAEDLDETRLVIVETDKTAEAFAGVHVGIGDAMFEQLVERRSVAHQ
jgi:hypothetical protein